MKYLCYLLLSYIVYLNCKPEADVGAEEAPEEPGAAEEGEDAEKAKEDFGKMVICENECLKHSGYMADKATCAKQPETPVDQPQIECIESKPEAKAPEEEAEGGEEAGEEPTAALKPRPKAKGK